MLAKRACLVTSRLPQMGRTTRTVCRGDFQMRRPLPLALVVLCVTLFSPVSGFAAPKLEATVRAFDSLTFDQLPTRREIQIKNKGDSTAKISNVTLEKGQAFFIGGTGKTATVLAGETNTQWWVQTIADVGAIGNIYTDTIIIQYDNGAVAKTPISLAVQAAPGSWVTVSGVTIMDAPVGYTPEAYTTPVVVTNVGMKNGKIESCEQLDTRYFTIIPGSDSTVPANGQNTSWQIQPKAHLRAGTYSSYFYFQVDGNTFSSNVTFRVTGGDLSASGGTTETVSPTASMPVDVSAVVGNCEAWANVRSGPGTSHDIIGRVFLHESIELTQWSTDQAWCKVTFNGGNSVGWLSRQFIIVQK